jgi:streptomycin 6-kinase
MSDPATSAQARARVAHHGQGGLERASDFCNVDDLCPSCERITELLATVAAEARAEEREAVAFLERRGYRRCDIAACNCGAWHGGDAEQRLAEIREALDASLVDMRGVTILQVVGQFDPRSSRPGGSLADA